MKISFFFREGRPSPFEARWYVDRKQKSKFFLTAAERAKWAKGFVRGLARHGSRSVANDPKRVERWLAAAELLPRDVDPFAVAGFYLAHHKADSGLRLREAIRDFLWQFEQQSSSRDLISRYERVLNRLEASLGDLPLVDVTPQVLQRFVFSLEMSAVSRRNHRTALSVFFKHFFRLEKISANPVAGVPVPAARSVAPVGTLDAVQVARLFDANREDKAACAILALGCFAGMRSSAVGRVELEDIRFAERGLFTPAAKTKKSRRQFLQGFPDNLWPWLEQAPKGTFASDFPRGVDGSKLEAWKICNKRRFDTIRNRALKRAGLLLEAREAKKRAVPVKAPPHNWARHSFVSYHVALFKDPGKTAFLISHKSDPQVLYESYLGERTEAEARVYFSILP
jgi:integrase